MSKDKLSRREFLRLTSALAASSALAACAPQATQAPEPTGGPPATTPPEQPAATSPPEQPAATAVPPAAEAKPVQYWTGWGGDWSGKTWTALTETDRFKSMFAPDQVQLKGAVEYEAFLTAVAAGTPPDGASNIPYVDYMARDVLLPVEEYVAASSIIKKDDFVEGNWNQGFYKGAQLGVPAIECFLQYGLDYNIHMVGEAGLDPEKPPVTWDDVAAWNEKLNKFDAAGNVQQIGLDPFDAMAGGVWDTSAFFVPLSFGFDWWNEDTGAFNLNDQGMVDGLQTMSDIVKAIGADQLAGLHAVEGQGQWGDSYNAEVQAMIIEGYWHPGETQAAKPEVAQYNRATWIPVPASRAGQHCQGTGGHLVIMFKDATNPDGMFQVTEFLNTPEAYDTIFKSIGWLPASKSFIAATDPSAYPGLDFYFKSVTEANDWRAPEKCPITEFINQSFAELYDKVNRDEVTAKDAADELQRRAEEEFKAQGFGTS